MKKMKEKKMSGGRVTKTIIVRMREERKEGGKRDTVKT